MELSLVNELKYHIIQVPPYLEVETSSHFESYPTDRIANLRLAHKRECSILDIGAQYVCILALRARILHIFSTLIAGALDACTLPYG